jgi:hypothetical protein
MNNTRDTKAIQAISGSKTFYEVVIPRRPGYHEKHESAIYACEIPTSSIKKDGFVKRLQARRASPEE